MAKPVFGTHNKSQHELVMIQFMVNATWCTPKLSNRQQKDMSSNPGTTICPYQPASEDATGINEH